MDTPLLIKNLHFDGNHLCLDFINTIHDRSATKPRDYIVDKTTWTQWLIRKELLRNQVDAETLQFDLEEIRTVRELLYRTILSVVNKERPAKRDNVAYNRLLLKLRKSTHFQLEVGSPIEVIKVDPQRLNSYLLFIIDQSHKLMLAPKVASIKECGNCGWLFLDTSKSGKRRWCNMKTCGNEVKARRHYQKIRENKKRHDKTIES